MKEFIVNEAGARKYKRKSLVAFIIFFAMLAISWAGWKYLRNEPKTTGVQTTLRKVLDLNEEVYKGLYSTQPFNKRIPKIQSRTQGKSKW